MEEGYMGLAPGLEHDYGDGSGKGYGVGNGDGSGYGSGYGHGYGNGYGLGDGYGDGGGYGHGYGDGSGDGCGNEIVLPQDAAWTAYHYIVRRKGKYITRSGKEVGIGEVLCEPDIMMCRQGLHASLSREDAKEYRPERSVLTRVKVWGRMILCRDKLVATHRQIVGEC